MGPEPGIIGESRSCQVNNINHHSCEGACSQTGSLLLDSKSCVESLGEKSRKGTKDDKKTVRCGEDKTHQIWRLKVK